MGQAKQLLQLGGESLVRRAVKTALQIGPKFVVVVLGANAKLIRSEINDLPCQLVYNSNWEEGMGSSLAVGMEAIMAEKEKVHACLIMLADQPFIQSDYLNLLISNARLSSDDIPFASSTKKIIASQYGEKLGVPALFDHSLFDILLSSNGDQGARKLLNANAHLIKVVNFPNLLFDIDTPEDFKKAQRKFEEE
jgi:molybdenum cofactor cytidylyltransferase